MATKEWILKIKESLWFRPVLWLLGMALLAFGFVAIDWFFLDAEVWDNMGFLFQSHVEGARTMLGAIIGATLTVASLAFSLMMVVVIQAANAYTPRLLHRFVADTHNHHVMGVLLGGFIYSIIVLRSLRDEPQFIPQLALNVSVLISVFALIALISFIHHVARSIEVGNIISLIEKQTTGIISESSYRRVGEELEPFGLEGARKIVTSQKTGYVRVLNVKLLESMLEGTDSTIQMHCSVGDHLISGSKLLTIWGDLSHDEQWCERAHSFFVLGHERSWVQDESYGLQQLTDISLRALSPGINDPFTAITAIHWIGAATSDIGRRDLRKNIMNDVHGTMDDCPVIPLADDFSHYLKRGFGSLRSAVAASPIAAEVMLDAMSNAATSIDSHRRQVQLKQQGELLAAQVREKLSGPDLEQFEAHYRRFNRVFWSSQSMNALHA